jgi:DNA-binding transcriptional MerR regulator
METLYGTKAAARLLTMNPARLKRWLDYGYFVPDFRAISGSTEYRLFSERDIQILRDILGRIEEGTPLGKAF